MCFVCPACGARWCTVTEEEYQTLHIRYTKYPNGDPFWSSKEWTIASHELFHPWNVGFYIKYVYDLFCGPCIVEIEALIANKLFSSKRIKLQ